MVFFGIVYLITTTLILLFKRESSKDFTETKPSYASDHYIQNDISLIESYKLVWKILSLKPILIFIFVIFTLRVSQEFYFF